MIHKIQYRKLKIMQIKIGGLLGCSGRTYSSFSVSGTHRVTIKRHEPYFFCISTKKNKKNDSINLYFKKASLLAQI
jgi:hypothetical protein